MSEQVIEGTPQPTTRGETLKTVLFVVVFLLLGVGVGGGGVYFLTQTKAGTVTADAEDDGEETDVADDEEEAAAAEQPSTPYYFSLDPAFVVNFPGRGRAKFLQVNIDGVTRDPNLKEDITTHLPRIRNNIVLLLSSKTYEDVITAEGKEKLRQEVLGEINKILLDETGKDDVEDVFFTSFVMQ